MTDEVDWGPGAADVLAGRAVALLGDRPRIIIGIAGPPGAGKSTIAAAVAEAVDARLPGRVAHVPMDGFHLAHEVIEQLGRVATKGEPATFDADGYVALLRRLRQPHARPVYAPDYRREVRNAVAAGIPVDPRVRVVVTEGNYLLLDQEPWSAVRALLDECWFVTLEPGERVRRLVERHRRFGADDEGATRRAEGSDERNAALVAPTAARADLLVRNR